MGFIDTHAHLFFPDYEADLDAVMERFKTSGIEALVNVGTDAHTSALALDLARRYDFIYASAGIHPHDAGKADAAAMREIEALLADPRVVAIGEVGLDFYRDHSPRETQEKVFLEFLELHQKTSKPLILHCRDAYEEMIRLLKSRAAAYRGVIHCFSSDKAVMLRLLDLGFHISFAGPLTYKKNDVLREACAACPQERLLLETDAPFLPPQTMRGKRNEPGFLIETAQTAAALHHVSLEKIGEVTSANARKVFNL